MLSKPLASTLLASTFLVGALLSPARASASLLDWSVGVKGGAGGDIWLAADETPRTPLFDGLRGGWQAGGGVFAELRILKFIGIEFDLFFFHDTIYEETDWNGGIVKTEERVTWNSLRIPLLLKGVLPLGPVRLSLGVGPEFAIGLSSTGSVKVTKNPQLTNVSATIKSRDVTDVFLAVALGLVIAAGPVSIPIDFRFGYNLDQPSTWSERIVWNGSTREARVRASSSMDARLLIGVAYEF